MKIIRKCKQVLLFFLFFRDIERGHFERAYKKVRMIEKSARCESLLSALIKTMVLYSIGDTVGYRAAANRVEIYTYTSPNLNSHERVYLRNFINGFFYLQGDIGLDGFDDSFDYNQVNSLYLQKFPYDKDKQKLKELRNERVKAMV